MVKGADAGASFGGGGAATYLVLRVQVIFNAFNRHFTALFLSPV